jgi:PAS domain S-box-containing protein
VLQTFLGITGVTTLLVGGLAHGLQQSKLELEGRVVERTAALERAHKRFRDLVESAPDAEVIVDQQGRIVLVNAQTERLFGYGREQLVGQPVEKLLPDQARDAPPPEAGRFYARPEPRQGSVNLELLGVRQDGGEFPVEVSISPLVTDEGVLVCAALRDITQRLEIEKRLRQTERLAMMRETIEKCIGRAVVSLGRVAKNARDGREHDETIEIHFPG